MHLPHFVKIFTLLWWFGTKPIYLQGMPVHLFHLASFRIFSLSIVFSILLWCALPIVFLIFMLLDFYCIQNLWVDLIYQLWNIVSHLLNYYLFFSPIPFLFSLWNHKYTVLELFTMPKISLTSSYLYFMALIWKCSSDQLSSWLILSSIVSNILLKSSIDFLPLFFSSKLSILLFFLSLLFYWNSQSCF